MHQYNFRLLRVVDGDTVDIDIDLGFDHWLCNQRIRLNGIDTPESRTRDPIEKKFGKLAANKVLELLMLPGVYFISRNYDRGKFGRILGDFGWVDTPTTLCEEMINGRYAVPYHGQSKDDIENAHLSNREWLIEHSKIRL